VRQTHGRARPFPLIGRACERGADLRVAAARRDDRRPGACRVDAGSARPRPHLRGLPCHLLRAAPARSALGWRAGSVSHDMGDLRALLPLDIPRRDLRRTPPIKRGFVGSLGHHHCRGSRGDPQPRRLVRSPCRLPGGRRGRGGTAAHGMASMVYCRPLCLGLAVLAAVAMFWFELGMVKSLALFGAAGLLVGRLI
jgi:hypothetical protein